MARTGITGVAFAAAGLLLFSFATSADADDVKVGVTAAVNPDTVGQPPAAQARTMLIGADVMFKERITTTDTGQAQLLFLDQSSLTVAPKSEVVIDEFVYDPKQNVGKLAANVTKGLMRYVGGAISKESEVQFATPSATVGIRGGMVLIQVNQAGGTEAAFLYGRHMNVTANGKTETVTRPGFTIAVGQPGETPSPPTPTQNKFIQDALLALEGRRGSTGGAPEPPTDVGFAQTGLGQQLEHIDPLAIQTTLSAGGGGPQQVIVAQLPNTTGIIDNAAQNQLRDTIATTVTTTPSTPSMTPLPPPIIITSPPPPPPTGTTLPSLLSGRFKSSPASGTALGTTDFSSTLDQGFAGATVTNGSFNVTVNGGTFSLPVPSQGATVGFGPTNTTTPFGPVAGTAFLSAGGDFLAYQLVQTSVPDGKTFLFAGVPTPANLLVSNGISVHAFTVAPDFMLSSNIPFLTQSGGGDIPGAQVSPLLMEEQSSGSLGVNATPERSTALQVSLAIDGQGASQRSAFSVMTGAFFIDPNTGKPTFEGGVRGTAREAATGEMILSTSSVTSMPDANGNTLFGATNFNYFALDSALGTGTAARVEQNDSFQGTLSRSTTSQYGFNQVVSPLTTPVSLGTTRTFQTLNGYAAGLGQSFNITTGTLSSPGFLENQIAGDPTQVMIRTFPQYNRLTAQFNLQVVGTDNAFTLNFGGVGGPDDFVQPPTGQAFRPGRSAFIDDSTFAAREQALVAGTDSAGTSTDTFNGVTVARSRAALATSSLANASSILPAGVSFCQCQYLQWGFWGGEIDPSQFAQRDAAHLALWVAGVLPTFAQIPMTGTATYNGHIIGNVYNNGAQYVAAGSFQNSWNFGTRSGSITITSFDNNNFFGTASATMANPRDYSGTFLSSNESLTGRLNGSFFSSPTDPVATTGGQFAISNVSLTGTPYKSAGIFAAKR